MSDLIPGTTAATSSAATSTSRSQYQEQYDTFLQLLTAQLRNQVPTDPLDTNEFTQQIVSYSSLEQQIDTNEQISSLIGIVSGFVNSNAMAFVGDVVSFEGASARLENGSATWTYQNSSAGVKGTIEIRDFSGRIVRTDAARTGAGSHTYTWNGRTDSGSTAPDGPYSISVVVRDSNDAAISVDTSVTGRVDAVDLSGSTPVLIVGDRRIDIGDVQTVRPGTTS